MKITDSGIVVNNINKLNPSLTFNLLRAEKVIDITLSLD